VSINFITRRPVATSVSIGDTYGVLGIDVVQFNGRQLDAQNLVQNMTWYGFWVEAKTVLNAPRKEPSVAPKPYIRYGAGVVLTPEVSVLNPTGAVIAGGELYIQTACPGVRTGLGVELRRYRVGLFLDVGLQFTRAPDKNIASDPNVGKSETVFSLPIRAGLTF
jgi:hypothetical protein